MLDTWLPVSQLSISVMVAVFHSRTVLSTVPPAVASTLACQGHQDTACREHFYHKNLVHSPTPHLDGGLVRGDGV